LFQFTFFVDASQLKYKDSYSGQGIAVRITVIREELQKFTEELKAEYQKFLEKNKDEIRVMHEEAGLPSRPIQNI